MGKQTKVDRQTDMDRQTAVEKEVVTAVHKGETDRQMVRETSRKTGKLADRQTD